MVRVDADEKPEWFLTVYNYHDTGIFAGQDRVRGQRWADGSTIYRLSRNQTMEPPPIVEDGEVAVFLERERIWIVTEDHRGELWFNWKGEQEVISRVGNPKEWGLKREQ